MRVVLPAKGRLGEGNVPKLSLLSLIFNTTDKILFLFSLIAFVSECFIEVQMFLSANAKVLSLIPIRKGKLETVWGM